MQGIKSTTGYFFTLADFLNISKIHVGQLRSPTHASVLSFMSIKGEKVK